MTGRLTRPVLVNARPLLPPRSGVGRYLTELLNAMLRAAPELRLTLFYHASLRPRAEVLAGRAAVEGEGVRHALVRMPFRAFEALTARGWPLLHTLGRMALYHEPNFLPLPSRAPLVVTVHDAAFLVCPETMPEGRRRALSERMPAVLARAAAIVVPSRHVKDDLVRLLGAAPEKVTVTPEAAAAMFHPVGPGAREACRRRLGLPARFLLAVGTLEPRKRFGDLIRWHAGWAHAASVPLVVAGARGWGDAAALPESVPPGRVRFLTAVGDDDLPALYASAAVVVVPSRYEGFGLPVLEAMACGVPVVCSAAVAEVAGDAAAVVSFDDDAAVTDAVTAVVEDAAHARRLVELGLARAGAFTWEACAARTLEAYAAAAS